MNMTTIQTFRFYELPPYLAEQARNLTKVGSQNYKWFAARCEGEAACDEPDDLVIAVATKDLDYEIEVIGWASTHCWDGIPCLEMFVRPDERGKKVATALSICVALAANVPKTTVGVFAPESISIAKNIGFENVVYYKRVEDGWIKHQEQGSKDGE